MKYLMFIKRSEKYRNEEIPQGLMDAMGEFVAEGFRNGTLKDTAGLKPTKDAFRVRSSNGKLTTTDGPFAETKEAVGGYAMIEVKTEAEAREIARRFMELHQVHWPSFEGECEARPVEDMPGA
jgi:hypothetical protein